jgi:alpha/beta superfamily hydrolase
MLMGEVVRDIAGPAGRLEALLEEPPPERGVTADGLAAAGAGSGLRAAVVFAHPHPLFGGTMHTKVVYRAAKALGRIGCAVVRFNFRGVGASAGTFDEGPGEMDDFRAALDFMATRYPDAPLWAGGFSFGAWVALTVGARDDRVSALIGIAPPLGDVPNLDTYDFSAVQASTKPKFFIQGDRDELCPLAQLKQFYAGLPEPRELVVIEDANHLFDGKTLEVGDAIEDLLGDFTSLSPSGSAHHA